MLCGTTERNTWRFRRKSSARAPEAEGEQGTVGEADAKDAEEVERVPT